MEGTVKMACITLISSNLEESTIHESIAVESDQESVMLFFFSGEIWGSDGSDLLIMLAVGPVLVGKRIY